MSLGTLKKFGGPGSNGDPIYDDDNDSEQSPALQYSRIQSRFQFAHSVDPIKKVETSSSSFKFGFGCGNATTTSEMDKDVILVPMKV
mmetsp:Transcript_5272/g.7052  ORF Transcript_5272/g.7052 Transcript_5272/m.7052 type:complete len:87 (-) Transcript_5272:1012-1272(-)